MHSHHPVRFNVLRDSTPKTFRQSPVALHMRAEEHVGLRIKLGVQNVGRYDRLNIQILRQGSDRVGQQRPRGDKMNSLFGTTKMLQNLRATQFKTVRRIQGN